MSAWEVLHSRFNIMTHVMVSDSVLLYFDLDHDGLADMAYPDSFVPLDTPMPLDFVNIWGQLIPVVR